MLKIKKEESKATEVWLKFMVYMSLMMATVLVFLIAFQTVDRAITNQKARESYEQMIKTNEQLERVSQDQESLLIDEREISDHLRQEFGLEVVD